MAYNQNKERYISYFDRIRNISEYKRTSSVYGISRTSLLLSVISLCRRGVVDILILDFEAWNDKWEKDVWFDHGSCFKFETDNEMLDKF